LLIERPEHFSPKKARTIPKDCHSPAVLYFRTDGGRGLGGAALSANDQTLAVAAAAGDRAAFAALVERHYERVHRLAWRWLGSRGEAEDVAQDVMVKLATAIRSFRGESAFSTWLYRIAYNTATDRIRERQRILPVDPSDMVALMDIGGGATAPDPAEAGDLWRAVRALPDQQRDAVLLVYGEDLSHAQAAAIMGIKEATVSWHVHEAHKRLKTRLTAAG
jgi:RNA polymerase sigma-70 factor, ECF subfamily